ncbi:MAG: zinc metallopeptidase [Acidobacteria bacterium]|nr:MAG: zinc metallopeptidase [Acidobacteriota bacterium]REK05593.1 MAG: zinc metallopeptidase [Acidobacteriota bacterium]
MFFDPIYFLFIGPGLLLSMWASFKTKSAFNKYSKVRSARGLTGAQAAQMMLDRAGIRDVTIKPARGFLSDHYNPLSKSLALSDPVYGSTSIAAIGVACHEAGHAIQHATGYQALKLRSALVPTVNIGSNFSWIAIMGGFLLNSQGLILAGIALFSTVVLFQLITLPVEFDASKRARQLAVSHGIVLPQEEVGMGKVLNAAALTYVAAAITSVLTLLYFLMRAGLLGGSRD